MTSEQLPQGMQIQPMEFKDFAGGMTDFYIGGEINRYRLADNLLILKHGEVGKLFTRPGSSLYDTTYYQIPPGAQRIGALKYFGSTLFYSSSRKLYYVNAGWVELVGPTSNSLFPTGIDTTNVVSFTTWNNHLYVVNDGFSKPQKIYQDGSAVWQLRTAGLPALASAPTVTPSGGAGHTYLYRFIYSYSYANGTRTFTNKGTATEVASGASGTPDVNQINIAAIPVLANGATDNYATTVITVEIYRTTDGGQNFFYVGNVTNGTTTYADTMSDTTLQNHAPLYTEGGLPDNDTPPPAKSMHVVESRAFYANCKVNSVLYPNRVYQSIPGAIDSVPATFFHDFKDSLVAVSSVRNLPIALGDSEVYRLDDGIDELGRGDITPVTLTTNGGCVAASSVVQTPEGVWWAGQDGFYYTDGFSVIRVSGTIKTSYKALVTTATRKRRIVGKYDSAQRRIYWTCAYQAGVSECDTIFVLDLNWGISDNMPFTTLSGGADTPSNFAPTALEFVGGVLVRGDSRGYTFVHSDTVYTDPKINTSAIPSLWQATTLIWDFVSIATDFGTSFLRKWVTRCGVVCQNESNISLQINSINDNGRRTAALSPIRFRGNITWGDTDITWGDPTLLWNQQGLIDSWRRFPAQNLRCEYKQIELTNAKVVVASSETLGTCTVSKSAHTATIDSGTLTWPLNAIDYVLAFANDNYVREYTITARTDTVLTFTDSAGAAPNATGTKWVVRGKPKNEVMQLISFTLHYAVIGKTQEAFHLANTGEVGAS